MSYITCIQPKCSKQVKVPFKKQKTKTSNDPDSYARRSRTEFSIREEHGTKVISLWSMDTQSCTNLSPKKKKIPLPHSPPLEGKEVAE